MTIADFVSSLPAGTEFGLDELRDRRLSEIMAAIRYLNSRGDLVKVRPRRSGQTARWRKS